MAFVLAGEVQWHEGEKKMHQLMHVPYEENPTAAFLSPGAAALAQRCPLLALGTLDKQGRPWSTIWGGQAGFVGPVAQSIIGIRNVIDGTHDPVAETLLGGELAGTIVKEPLPGRLMSALPIDMENRRRVKLMGRMVAGSMEEDFPEVPEDRNINDSNMGKAAQVQLVMKVEGSLGNCPKYINKKRITPAKPCPKLISDSPQLPQGALDLLNRIDTLFVASSHANDSMDSNIRGGPPGFVRVLSNDNTGAVIVYPEYSGNRLYQTLGNLQTTPLAGYAFPDFELGHILYITGKTEVLVGNEAAKMLPRSNLAVKVSITAARYVENGISFRGEAMQRSPYNPEVRYLTSEKPAPGSQLPDDADTRVTLVKKDVITPTISRFRFKASDPSMVLRWIPGQYATVSFRDELDMGYSHMRDDDPTSINDDYIRTFTVSSYPGRNLAKNEFEITVRKKGNATSHLFRASERSGLELSLRGFDGSFRFESPESNQNVGHDNSILPFIAGGIGITPVLAQLPDIDTSRLKLLWSVSLKDIGLVYDVFEQFPTLPNSTTLFLTSGSPTPESDMDENDKKALDSVISSGAKIERRRLIQEDLSAVPDASVWYLCAGTGLKTAATNWLTGKKLFYEDFNY
ncbi:oxidoreductase FAD/NAD(P)-binding [Nannizzia gypsea CBS 118893]|uniref:Oxidoreductase FAD/NAD(P)-binding n=1 Tax=Arthroderma gypseum (strain ATCC MYA-4604 / CBS 118893) TaxID=535722 RepID=E5R0X4_ARTGP|nr:oxidoreductase FAD/NAD(P)-binding [Nannizzia gypsea CBS 118893]EFQ98416.1 oxidoreductase FAD/NAD(P)-binding [Nannizzia gypsea CBS 118893]